MSRNRKHGVFTVSGDMTILPMKGKVIERTSITIQAALYAVFMQINPE